MRSARTRSRLFPSDIRPFLRYASREIEPHSVVSRRAHRRRHGYASMVYTSPATLTLNPGSPLYPLRPGRLIGVRAQVAGAPNSGDLIYDVLFDDQSVFYSSTPNPRIQQGQTYGYMFHSPDRQGWTTDTKIQIKINQINGAIGPMIVELLYEPDHR